MKKAKILIVEDEAIIAMEMESELQNLGYEVTSIVDTGEKAIEKAAISGTPKGPVSCCIPSFSP